MNVSITTKILPRQNTVASIFTTRAASVRI